MDSIRQLRLSQVISQTRVNSSENRKNSYHGVIGAGLAYTLAQVEISNSVFVLRDEIKAKAKEILEEIQSASAGAVTDKDGMMIDQAHFRWASRILEI